MTLANKRILIQKGFKAFEAKHYNKSLQYFGDALRLDPENLEAKIGLLLSDMAGDFPNETIGFYELYQTMIVNNPRSLRKTIQKSMLESIQNFDSSLDKIAQIIDASEEKIDLMNGILYSDFLELCKTQDFKHVFENLIFSTKIIFTKHDDFYAFLEQLVDNDLDDYCLQYIESMHISQTDERIAKILSKISSKN